MLPLETSLERLTPAVAQQLDLDLEDYSLSSQVKVDMMAMGRPADSQSGWRHLKNSFFLGPFREVLWRGLVAREDKSLRALGTSAGMSALHREHPIGLSSNPTNQTFFVLGNGGSVNDLTGTNFEAIRAGVSVGINAWPLHPFRPTYFAFEYWRFSFAPDPELRYLVNVAERKLIQGPTRGLLFLRPGLPASLSAVIPLSPNVSQRAAMYGRANLLSQSQVALRQDLVHILKLIQRGRLAPSVLPDNGSSVVRMIFLGLILGFRDIVLVGVDLNGSPYFWEDTAFVPDPSVDAGYVVRSPSDSTSTEQTQDRPFSVSDFIATLAPLAQHVLGATVSCASAKSRLAGALPVYSFGE
jgi:hypothetical protein